MKKSLFIALIAMGMAVNAQSTWKSDNAHTNMNFSVSHLVISEVTGKFRVFDIEAQADENFNAPSFSVKIEPASIDTDNERRDNHLRSADFFEVEAYPAITFTSTAVEKTGENTFKLTGDLTMHGVTRQVTLDGKLNGIITDQRSQKLKAGLKFTTTLNREDYNIGTGTMAPIGKEVSITINTEMAQQ